MTDTFEARFQRIVRQILDLRLELLAIMMAEAAIDAETARSRLTQLVHTLRHPRIEDTIFEGGRRKATKVDDGALIVNRELLERVGDSEVLSALASPVAQITGLASVGVSLAFQLDDDQMIRDMSMKGQRRAENEVVRSLSIPEWVQSRIEMLTARLGRLCANFGRASLFDSSGAEELQIAVGKVKVWPEWGDVSSVDWCARVVAGVVDALEDTKYQQHADTLTELMWDSLVLSPQSFIRHAGRTFRGAGSRLDIGDLLFALARAATGNAQFSTDVADWPAYQDVAEAWKDLDRNERAMFGPVFLNDRTTPASVVHPAGVSFGLEEPKELPWDAPLVCWTAREQKALRDLLNGFIRTLPGYTEDALEGHQNVGIGHEPPLSAEGGRRTLGIQVVALGADNGLMPAGNAQRAWASSVGRVVQQFATADGQTREFALEATRAAYDKLFPESQPIWARRLFDLDRASDDVQFERLVTTINQLFHAPVFFDPFIEPGSHELAPTATLVLPVGMAGEGKVPFAVPVVALTSTLNGAPLRVRVVHVPAPSDSACRWISDRGLHLSKLSQQSVELITNAIRGDALHMAVFDS